MISIRRVEPQEADELTRIALAAKRHWGYPERWIEVWTPELTFDAKYFETNESWAAEVNDRLIAFYTLLDKQGMAWIENLWVHPDSMGKGIGKTLFLHAVELARQRGYKHLQLEADPNAAGFYEKMGMHKIGERHSEVEGQPRSLPIMEIYL
ncbi:MAG TPA: GNAT family N-acetyltransferase [Anaerolineales bacterium]|nr:GNAT family N-acetyltransferase [Anaerolineales bacterium]